MKKQLFFRQVNLLIPGTVRRVQKNTQYQPALPSGEEKAQEQGKELAVKKIKTIERDKRTIKTGRTSEQVVKNTGKGTIKIRITKEEGVT